MKIYVYAKDGKVVDVSGDAGAIYLGAWYDFKERYISDVHPDQETEDKAFGEFCDYVASGTAFEYEFEITEWDL